MGGFIGNQVNSTNINVVNSYWLGEGNGNMRSGSFRGGYSTKNNNNQLLGGITLTNSFYNKELFTLSVPETVSGKGLTTEEMKQQSNYTGWDFDNVWYMGSDGYPELKF